MVVAAVVVVVVVVVAIPRPVDNRTPSTCVRVRPIDRTSYSIAIIVPVLLRYVATTRSIISIDAKLNTRLPALVHNVMLFPAKLERYAADAPANFVPKRKLARAIAVGADATHEGVELGFDFGTGLHMRLGRSRYRVLLAENPPKVPASGAPSPNKLIVKAAKTERNALMGDSLPFGVMTSGTRKRRWIFG